jgi:hypothetical protein
MTKTEFTTIADALKTKHSWIRKSFEDLLSAWCEATKDMECIGNVYIGDIVINDEYTHHVYLVPESNKLFFREESQYDLANMDYYISDVSTRDELTISLIRWATPKISPTITKHFKRIQRDIDALSETADEIRRITTCLEK